jgi:hypothetical protein
MTKRDGQWQHFESNLDRAKRLTEEKRVKRTEEERVLRTALWSARASPISPIPLMFEPHDFG